MKTVRSRKLYSSFELYFSAQGWEWLISLTQRISMGRQMELTVGDFLLKLITIVGQIYEPLVQLAGPRIPEEVQTTSLYRHPHSMIAARAFIASGQFSHCELCRATTCPVNILYARLFASVYFFVRNINGLTGEQFGVGSVRMLIIILIISKDLICWKKEKPLIF